MLPETTSDGAETVERNLAVLVAGVVGREVRTESITDVGGDEDPLTALREALAAAR